MHGFWKMLLGKGETENREAHKKFNDAIPNLPGFKPEDHPAVAGPLANGYAAADYRRMNSRAKSKLEHAADAEIQKALRQYEKENHVSSYMTDPRFLEWLNERPLPSGVLRQAKVRR